MYCLFITTQTTVKKSLVLISAKKSKTATGYMDSEWEWDYFLSRQLYSHPHLSIRCALEYALYILFRFHRYPIIPQEDIHHSIFLKKTIHMALWVKWFFWPWKSLALVQLWDINMSVKRAISSGLFSGGVWSRSGWCRKSLTKVNKQQ